MLYDVDIEASACVLSSRYAMLCLCYCQFTICYNVSHNVYKEVTGTFAPKNFRSWERKFQELSLPGTFAPWLSSKLLDLDL